MSLVTLIFVLVVVGIVLYLINRFIPMEPNIKQLLNIAVLIFLVVWILFGVFGTAFLSDIRIGR